MTTTASTTAVERSPFFRPSNRSSSSNRNSRLVVVASKSPRHVRQRSSTVDDIDSEEEHKSTLLGCTANLMTTIVGSGIVGIPYALKQTGFGAGVVLLLFTALMTEKSLRLLVATAKHIHVGTYETLAEAAFGKVGFALTLTNMWIIAYGAMISYLIIVKESLSLLLDIDDPFTKRSLLIAVSATIMLPLCCLRDMADLYKTSRAAVAVDILLVAIVAWSAAPNILVDGTSTSQRVDTNDLVHWESLFVGLGVMSFAFECQESSFLVAGSLQKPTVQRWSIVTRGGLSLCAGLMLTCGVFGYLGYRDATQGNILNNLDMSQWQGPLAHVLLGLTMFAVYPINSFVARHVLVVLLFEGRQAHEGQDSSILARRDRRIIITTALYLASLLPACLFTDIGVVLAVAGILGGSSLAYIGPGLLFLGVHGGRFMELVEQSWLFSDIAKAVLSNGTLNGDAKDNLTVAVETTPLIPSPLHNMQDTESPDAARVATDAPSDRHVLQFIPRMRQRCTYYLLGMPLWMKLASLGKTGLTKHVHELTIMSPYPIRIGDVEFTLTDVLLDNIAGAAADGTHADKQQQQRRRNNGEEPSTPIVLYSNNNSSFERAGIISPRTGLDTLPPLQYNASKTKSLAAPFFASSDHTVVEPDPQEAPPTATDFGIAIFYICFGVLALLAGLISLFSQ